MLPALFACRLILSAVFLLAGIAKLLDGSRTRRSIEPFLPSALASALAGLLPIVELAVGVAFLSREWAWLAALIALALLLLFLAVTAATVARGYVPSCGCFGALSAGSSVIGVVVRNEVLLAFCAFILVAGRSNVGPDAIPWLRTLSMGALIALVALLVAAALVVEWAPLLPRVVRAALALRARLVAPSSHAGIRSRHVRPSEHAMARAGLQPGTAAPAVSLDRGNDADLTWDSLLSQRRPALLVFSDVGCAPCDAVRGQLVRWREANAGRCSVVIVGGEGCSCDGRAQAARLAYRVPAVPSAVVIDADGRVASHVATGVEAITALTSAIA
jgi:uncharacterized membrane protein YphA (DoxX/SURF4 family)